nr:glutaredoxin family protein [Deinobacterium chartae]
MYTTPTCPDCHALKRYLERRGVNYLEKNLEDPAVSDEAKQRYGVRIAPVTVIGEQVFWGTFAEQRPRLDAALP